MYAVVGIACLELAALSIAVMLLTFRKPNPPKWTSYALTHEAIAIGTVAVGSFGLAFLLQAINTFTQQPPTGTHLIAIAVAFVLFVVVWRWLKVRATLAEYARQLEKSRSRTPISHAASAEESAPEDPSSPTRPRTPHVPKKAA